MVREIKTLVALQRVMRQSQAVIAASQVMQCQECSQDAHTLRDSSPVCGGRLPVTSDAHLSIITRRLHVVTPNREHFTKHDWQKRKYKAAFAPFIMMKGLSSKIDKEGHPHLLAEQVVDYREAAAVDGGARSRGRGRRRRRGARHCLRQQHNPQDLKPLTAATLIPAESLQGRPSPALAEASDPADLQRNLRSRVCSRCHLRVMCASHARELMRLASSQRKCSITHSNV